MKAARFSVTMALTFIAASRSMAGEAECEAVVAALMQMVRQPIVRQTDTRSDFPGAITMIFAEQAMYVSAGGTWKTMEVPAARRISDMQLLLQATPPTECTSGATEAVDGLDAVAYAFRQGPEAVRIWVGTADGLPYRLQGGVVDSRIDYAGVVVPVP